MKKHFIKMAALLFVLHAAAALHAQVKAVSNTESPAAGPLADTSEHSAKTIATSRAIQGFEKSFPGATEVSWMKADNDFAVRFTQNGIQQMAFITKKGACHDYIRYYVEKDLPADVRSLVKSTYLDYNITRIQEVNHYGTTAYLVTIEDGAKWMVIRVVDGEMDVYGSYRKG